MQESSDHQSGSCHVYCLLAEVGDASTSAANKEVEKADAQHRKKRGTYHHYDDEIRAKIAKYSCIYELLKFIFA